jgi:hypothetical protein
MGKTWPWHKGRGPGGGRTSKAPIRAARQQPAQGAKAPVECDEMERRPPVFVSSIQLSPKAPENIRALRGTEKRFGRGRGTCGHKASCARMGKSKT